MNALSSVNLGPYVLQNRVFLAPLTRARSDGDGVPGDLEATYYTQRSGAGLLITEGTCISPQGHGWHHAPGIYSDQQKEAWKAVVNKVNTEGRGAKFFLQLWHLGRQSHSSVTGMPIVSASTVAIKGEARGLDGAKLESEIPHALTEEEISGVVQDYATAAKNSMDAGFDGVEVHGANGYLIDQFVQSITNHREDCYGGSIANRLRFALQVVDAVIAAVGDSTKVGYRLSPNSTFGEMGSPDSFEAYSELVRELIKRNIGYIHVLDGEGFGEPYTGTGIMSLEVLRGLVNEEAKDRAPLLIGNTGYTFESANNAIGKGFADAIAFGRLYISNPDLAERFASGSELEPPAEYPTWWNNASGAKGYIDWSFANDNK